MSRRIYLDSCVVIYLIQGASGLSRAISSALRSGDAPVACISDLTRLECRTKPLQLRDSTLLREFDDFFLSRDVERLPFDSEAFDLATELRARHGIKTPDALHLATAIRAGCSEFWTNDLKLRAAAGDRIAVRMFPAS